jgi:hypothetical protein
LWKTVKIEGEITFLLCSNEFITFLLAQHYVETIWFTRRVTCVLTNYWHNYNTFTDLVLNAFGYILNLTKFVLVSNAELQNKKMCTVPVQIIVILTKKSIIFWHKFLIKSVWDTNRQARIHSIHWKDEKSNCSSFFGSVSRQNLFGSQISTKYNE